ncbi:MAG: DUF1990 family protein [Saprospiraceae bacterium]|nr:DUF1990 family protein [Saprospiraceae bacterium]
MAGYDNDLNTIELGRGEGVWLAAKEAVRQWKMFPGGWSYITNMKVWHGTLNAAGFGWLVLHGWVQASKAQENA